jgi:hypothetical protein
MWARFFGKGEPEKAEESDNDTDGTRREGTPVDTDAENDGPEPEGLESQVESGNENDSDEGSQKLDVADVDNMSITSDLVRGLENNLARSKPSKSSVRFSHSHSSKSSVVIPTKNNQPEIINGEEVKKPLRRNRLQNFTGIQEVLDLVAPEPVIVPPSPPRDPEPAMIPPPLKSDDPPSASPPSPSMWQRMFGSSGEGSAEERARDLLPVITGPPALIEANSYFTVPLGLSRQSDELFGGFPYGRFEGRLKPWPRLHAPRWSSTGQAVKPCPLDERRFDGKSALAMFRVG